MQSDSQKNISLNCLNREAAIALASDLVVQLHERVSHDRFREQKGDRTRVAYVRVLISALQAYGTLLRDLEIATLEKRLEELEKRQEIILTETSVRE